MFQKKKMKNKSNILIIGGEGYIGNILSAKLLNANYHVTSYDNLLYNNSFCVLDKIDKTNYNFIYGDMCDKKSLENSLKGIDTVVLLAGLVGDPITKKYPVESSKINDDGVKNVIDLCAKKNIKQFIFVSTCSNYGLIENNNLADEEYELSPLSLYAKSKVNAEKYILSLKGKTEMNPTILRFATAFGSSPRMRFDLSISEFTRELYFGNELLVYDAETWRPYCHVKDFARLIQLVIETPSDKVSYQVFNAGGESNNATKQMIVDLIIKKLPKGNVKYKKHGNDPRNYRVNFNKVSSILGFYPKYSIENGIDELIELLDNHIFDNISNYKNFFGNHEIDYPIL